MLVPELPVFTFCNFWNCCFVALLSTYVISRQLTFPDRLSCDICLHFQLLCLLGDLGGLPNLALKRLQFSPSCRDRSIEVANLPRTYLLGEALVSRDAIASRSGAG